MAPKMSLIDVIRVCLPVLSFIAEESVAAGAPSILTDDPTWIIDPIDGTTNFVHGCAAPPSGFACSSFAFRLIGRP